MRVNGATRLHFGWRLLDCPFSVMTGAAARKSPFRKAVPAASEGLGGAATLLTAVTAPGTANRTLPR